MTKSTTSRTKRLTVSPMTDQELAEMVQTETDPEMQKAYTEMLDGCKASPADRLWYTAWRIALHSGQVIGDLCFKGPL